MFLKRNTESIIAFALFVITTFIYFYFEVGKGTDHKLYLGLIGIIATLYFGMLKSKVENDNIFKELFIQLTG